MFPKTSLNTGSGPPSLLFFPVLIKVENISSGSMWKTSYSLLTAEKDRFLEQLKISFLSVLNYTVADGIKTGAF